MERNWMDMVSGIEINETHGYLKWIIPLFDYTIKY